jgi:predicted RND superfamily exporter protein
MGELFLNRILVPVQSIYTRYRWVLFLAFSLSLPVIFYGAQQARKSRTNRIQDWSLESLEETRQLLWFLDHFGTDELLMISWEGCTLEDSRLTDFARLLAEPVVHRDGHSAPWFRKVFTGPDAMEAFRSSPLDLTEKQAKARLAGWLLGNDGETTCAVVIASPEGMRDREAAVAYVYDCADRVAGLSSTMVHAAGPTMESVAINEASKEGLGMLISFSLLLALILACACLRSVALGLMVFVAAMYSQQLSTSLFHFAGSRMDSVALMVPTLVYVLSISAGIHVVNYYRDALATGGLDHATRRAVRFAWRPCSLAAVTTALGLISLLVSQLKPVRRFGGFGATGVLLGLIVLFLLLPSLLEQFPPRRWASRLPHSPAPSRSEAVWASLARFTTRFYLPISALGLACFLAGAWGVACIQPTARLHDLFADQEARVIRDYAWLEEHIAGLVPVEVVIDIPRDAPASILDRMWMVERASQEMEAVPGVEKTISAASFATQLPELGRGGARQIARRSVVRRQLEERRDKLVGAGYLRDVGDRELWRITARVKASHKIDYGPLLKEIRQRVTEHVIRPATEQFPDISAVFSGSIPVAQRAQDQLLTDLIKSFIGAFVLVGLAMILMLRSLTAGLLSMIPNLLPAVTVLGAMGWLGVPVEVGSMMTASVALGIAVDDTLHYVTWFREGLRAGMPRRKAIRFAYRRCATAMLQTSLICGLGLIVFSQSPFAPIARFSWLMVAMLATALLGDLIVLPAILAGPLGRAFQVRAAP